MHRCCSTTAGSGRSLTMASRVASATIMSLRLAEAFSTASGKPWPSHSWLRLVPRLFRATGGEPVASPPKGDLICVPSRLCHCHSKPASSSYSCKPACHKRVKTPWRSHKRKRAETVLEAPSSRGIAFQGDNGCKHLAIIGGWSSAFGMGRTLWDQRAHALPQGVTAFPWLGSSHDGCSFAALFVFLSLLLILSPPTRFPDKFLRVSCSLRGPCPGDRLAVFVFSGIAVLATFFLKDVPLGSS